MFQQGGGAPWDLQVRPETHRGTAQAVPDPAVTVMQREDDFSDSNS